MTELETYPHLRVTISREDVESIQHEGPIARIPATAEGGTIVWIVASTEHIGELMTRATRFSNTELSVKIPLHAIEGAV